MKTSDALCEVMHSLSLVAAMPTIVLLIKIDRTDLMEQLIADIYGLGINDPMNVK